jgi:hypothetical protein
VNRLTMTNLLAAALVLAGCAAVGGSSDGPAAPAPTFRVGDRWVYRASDGFRVPVTWDETHEVTAVSADGITVRVTQIGPTVNNQRTELWATPGMLKTGAVFDEETRRFNPPLPYYEFPLSPGKRWGGWVDQFNVTTNKAGQINRYVTVHGWAKVPTPAGTFDAIRMRVLMRLDDEEFWRYPTTCNYLLFYAPAVGAIVRAEKDAEYWEKGGGDMRGGTGAIRAQHAALELTSYTRR